MKLYSGSSNIHLAERLAKELGSVLSPREVFVFPDGERRIRIEDDVLDQDVVIIQSASTPVDSHYMELFFLIDSANRSGASSVSVVMPYLGYQRQDHIFRSGEAVSFSVVVRMLESLSVDHIYTSDLHTIKIPEFFHIPFTEVSALPLFEEEIKKRGWDTKESFLVSADRGGIRRVKNMSEMLSFMPYIVNVKERDLQTGSIAIGSFEGDTGVITKRALIIDDMISSGKTIVKGAELLKKHGVEEIYVFVTHAIFSEDAPRILQESVIDTVYVTDSVLVPKDKQFSKLEILSLSSSFAKVLKEQSLVMEDF